MDRKTTIAIAAGIILVAAFGFSLRGKKTAVPVAGKPAMTVTPVQPEQKLWDVRITASGSIQPWQETIIGAEVGGLRLAAVPVNVGDKVKKGELLARFADEMKLADLAQQQASFEEARAHFNEMQANALRAAKVTDSGAISSQELQQYATNAETARAQMKLAQARLEAESLRVGYTRVTAPDDGVISSRTATVGAVIQSGAELFRMIRQGRLEWQADLPSDALPRVYIGQKVAIDVADGNRVSATVTRISPVVDMSSRNGKVYVELPQNRMFRAGMFVQGEFELGKKPALTLPQSAVVMRDGYSYVYRLGKDSRVVQVKVITGRRQGDRVEILGGISPDMSVAATGAGFLNDGDLVRVAQAGEPAKPPVKP